jgi:glucose/arabinose dehydrogenase
MTTNIDQQGDSGTKLPVFGRRNKQPRGWIMRRQLNAFFGRALPAVAAGLIAGTLLSACNGSDGSNGRNVTTPAMPGSFPAIALSRVASGFTQPVQITHAADGSGRLFVLERAGVILILRNGIIEATPFLDISGLVKSSGSEQGLLGLAFPPDFSKRGHFYLYYTDHAGVGDSVLARYRISADPDVADPASAETLFRLAQPFANHNGGQLTFGPDGFLYFGLGDGGSAGDPLGNAQNPASRLGKLLRIDVEAGVAPYAIPAGNPFGNEIWATGLRNPWRFSFDRVSGDLYIGDVGQNAFEEVNFQPAASPGGQNYGWDRMEGMHCFAGMGCDQTGLTAPVAEYSHADGNCSITGGYVYRGAQYPSQQGIYLYGDFCSGRLWGLRQGASGWENHRLLDSGLNLSTFGEDETGNLYVADYGSGSLYRIVLP